MSGTVLYPAEFGPPPEKELVPDLGPAVPWRVARLLLEIAARSASAVDGALTRVPPARRVAVDVVIGGGAVAYEVAGRVAGRLAFAARSITGGTARLPLMDGPQRAVSRLAARGRQERAAAGADLERLAEALVPVVTAAVLDRLDLTTVVRDRVALDAIVAEVDVDAVAARVDVDAVVERVNVDAIARRVDIDAIVERLDLISLANRVIDGIDLPEIIRESTGSVTGDMVRGVRMQGIEADQAVAGLVARLLRRRPRQSAVDTAVPEPRAPQ